MPKFTTYEDPDSMYMTFVLGDAFYGIPVRDVIEIIGLAPIDAIPNSQPWLRGVISLRGKVIPIMDLRIRLDMEPREYDSRTCIVIVRSCVGLTGIVVDTVHDVTSITNEQITSSPDLSELSDSGAVSGIGQPDCGTRILLDVEQLLRLEDTKIVA